MNYQLLIFSGAFLTAWIMLEVFLKVSLSFANESSYDGNDNFLTYLRLISFLLFIPTFLFFVVNEDKFTNIILFICSI
ncbi:MAG: hypothetical protein VX114_03465 [Chloroflexota bacterium]|nr:hypothetical protein [Chloroflexota bacterium]